MATNIQVTEDTLQMLKRLRQLFHAGSYNEVVVQLVKHELARKSMWGAGKKIDNEANFGGLRDKSDRF